MGTLFLVPTVCSHFCSNCFTSLPAKRRNGKIQLHVKNTTDFWTTERLPHFVTHFCLPLSEATIHPVLWWKSVWHRRRRCPGTEWPKPSHMLRFQISIQSPKLLLDNETRTFKWSQLHQTLQASGTTIQDHYGPQSAPLAQEIEGFRRFNCSLAWKTRCLWLWDWAAKRQKQSTCWLYATTTGLNRSSQPDCNYERWHLLRRADASLLATYISFFKQSLTTSTTVKKHHHTRGHW